MQRITNRWYRTTLEKKLNYRGSADVLKSVALGVIGVAVLVLVLWTNGGRSPEWAVAQESPLDSPLVTPAPTKVPRTVNEVVHPKPGNAIAGETEIIGTALITDFLRYDIHMARTGEDRWSWVASNSDVIHDDVLHVLQTRGYPDGRYDLRVRAVNMQGDYTEEFVENLEIRNARPPTATPDPNVTPAPRAAAPTPTATPDLTTRLPGGHGIYAPDNGAVLRNTVDVIGAVGGQYRNPFSRFEVAISPAAQEEWTQIRTGSEQGMQILLVSLNTTQYPDGLYDLRLRVYYQDGEFNDYFLRQLSIANQGEPQFAFMPVAGMISPRSGDQVSGVVPVVATVPSVDLVMWELAWSVHQAEEWHFLTRGERPVTESELARLDLRLLPPGLYDFRLRIVRMPASQNGGLPNNAEQGNLIEQDYFVRGVQLLESEIESEVEEESAVEEIEEEG